jgi:DNA polymerase III delta prime subunit
MNAILGREAIVSQITDILARFKAEHNMPNFKKGIYLYGSPGVGKTKFITDILTSLNYNIVRYDSGDLRNKGFVESLVHNNILNNNTIFGAGRKMVILMDEIDGMNSGDKGGITALIKLIRQKKTKKQKSEKTIRIPIVCIGNYGMDKKMVELVKGCTAFELSVPTELQMEKLVHMFSIDGAQEIEGADGDSRGRLSQRRRRPAAEVAKLVAYAAGDIRRLLFAIRLYKENQNLFGGGGRAGAEEGCGGAALDTVFHIPARNKDSKNIVHHLLNTPEPMARHPAVITDTNRTVVALLYHENVVDAFRQVSVPRATSFYLRFLDNMCFADFIDRITFQNQIWIFNEMSSLLKVFRGNKMFHDAFPEMRGLYRPAEVRFTKVLTKYSTEYNNQLFIYSLCQKMDLDKTDMLDFFRDARARFGGGAVDTEFLSACEQKFDHRWVSRLEAKRIYRYLDKNVPSEAAVEELEEVEYDDIVEYDATDNE